MWVLLQQLQWLLHLQSPCLQQQLLCRHLPTNAVLLLPLDLHSLMLHLQLLLVSQRNSLLLLTSLTKPQQLQHLLH